MPIIKLYSYESKQLMYVNSMFIEPTLYLAFNVHNYCCKLSGKPFCALFKICIVCTPKCINLVLNCLSSYKSLELASSL